MQVALHLDDVEFALWFNFDSTLKALSAAASTDLRGKLRAITIQDRPMIDDSGDTTYSPAFPIGSLPTNALFRVQAAEYINIACLAVSLLALVS
jgi:hypothetical protein